MTYCTLAELVATYGESDLRNLTDRANKPAQVIDEQVLARAIEDAAAEIDLHLQARYQLPLASVPLVLKRVAGQLAYAALHTRVDADHPAHQAAGRARKLLEGISSGRLSLGLDAAGAPAAVADTVQIAVGRNDFGGRW